MAKLQLQLLVLIALGTISRCQDAGGPPPDSVAVMSSGTPPWGCGPPKPPVNVRFNDIKVTGPDSDVVYHRVTVTDFQLQLATNTSSSLPSASFFECAKAAAGAGLEAFVFDGSCTGYKLNLHFLKCQTGDVVVYVRADYLDEEPVIVPIDEAPYRLIDDGEFEPYRKYMISDYVEADSPYDSEYFKKVEMFEDALVTESSYNYIFRENGDITASVLLFLDVNSCFVNGAYGLEIAVNPALHYLEFPIVFFFEECGNTVQVIEDEMRVFSHRGFGCKYYPSGLPDECTVTFEGTNSRIMGAVFGFFFPEANSDDGGLGMTITGTNTESRETETKNVFRSNNIANIFYKLTFEVSLTRQPTKRAIGFYLRFL